MSVGGAIALIVVAIVLLWTVRRTGVRFLVTSIAGLLFVLLGVSFVTFILGYFAPGDVVTAQLGPHNNPITAAVLRRFYGLDQPWYVQYGNYLNNLIHFNLGYSWLSRTQTVWSILQHEVPVSAELGISALLLSLVMGVPLGIYISLRPHSRADTFWQSVSLALYAIPSFVFIPFYFVLMVFLYTNGLPNLPVSSTDWTTQPLEWVAPVILFAIGAFAFWTRLVRTSMLEVLQQDYIRTARAKGLTELRVVLAHAFRNALIPLVTVIGPSLAFVVNGAFIFEDLFNIPGIGSQTISAVINRDIPVVQGTVILLATTIAVFNLLVDIVYSMLDPRVKVG